MLGLSASSHSQWSSQHGLIALITKAALGRLTTNPTPTLTLTISCLYAGLLSNCVNLVILVCIGWPAVSLFYFNDEKSRRNNNTCV